MGSPHRDLWINTSKDEYPLSMPSAFTEDRIGGVWIGAYQGGIARYSAGSFHALTRADGLPGGMVSSLYFDLVGRLWITTDSGVARLDDPYSDHPRLVVYTTASGLAGMTSGAFRTGSHDDLAIALGLACLFDPSGQAVRYWPNPY